MSSFEPNNEQRQFISELNKNVLVSASAGSGKTSSMVQKIISIIDSGVGLNEMLIVTYTIASANEMKQKLYRAISQKMTECREGMRDFYMAQLDVLNNCDIGTIHSFCKKVVSKYFYVIDQDTNFGILEKNDYLYSMAVRRVFNQYISAEDANFFELYESYNKKRDEKILINVIKTLHDFFSSKIDVEQWKQYVLDRCYNTKIDENICTQFVLDYYKTKGENVKKSLLSVKNIYVNDKYLACIDSRIAYIENIQNCNNFNQMLKLICADVLRKEPTNRLAGEYEKWIESYEYAVEQFKVYKGELLKLTALEFDEKEVQNVRDILRTLFEVVDKIKLQYDEYKKDKNLLDFSDLEHKCFDILSKSTDVANDLKENYKFIFIDEYQDINELQEAIINLIKRDNNLNLIGDIKQSIFAFRLATPKLFMEKYNTYPTQDKSCVVKFNENWRSENSILQFVNQICSSVITKQSIGIDYKNDAMLKYPDKKTKGQCCVEIDVINKPSKKEQSDDRANYWQIESSLIAKKIVELCNKTYIQDGVEKNYTYSDIAILVRKKTGLMEQIVSTLKQYNIPCNVSYKLDIFDSIVVQILYAVLKILNNTDDDLSCAIILKNLFGVDEEGLATIKNIGDMSLNVCCRQYEGDDNLSYKLEQYYAFIDDLNYMSTFMTLSDMLQNVSDKYLKHFLMRKNGKENKAYIDTFLSLIDNKLYQFDIKSCLEYISQFENNSVDVDISGGDGVQITTIHSSKGLEYKAVIFAGLGDQLSINLNTSDIVMSENCGVGLQCLDVENRIKKENVIKKACLLDKEREEVNEELRLLYVALTRGMKYMILTGSYSVDDIVSNKQKDIYSSRKYFDWIFSSLSSLDRKKFGQSKDFVIFEGTDSQAQVLIDDFDFDGVDEPVLEFDAPDDKVVQNIRQNLSWKYAFEDSKNIAIKNSVSGLLKESVDYEHAVDSFSLLQIGERLPKSDGAERGNAYHAVMQQIEFCKQNDIDAIIQSLGVQKYVDARKIRKCVEVVDCFASNAQVKKEAQFLMKVKHSEVVENGSDQKILVQGVVDLYIDDGEAITLIDYKTNRGLDENTLAKMYSTQMRLYAIALEKATGKRVNNIYLYSFDHDKLIDIKNYIKIKN